MALFLFGIDALNSNQNEPLTRPLSLLHRLPSLYGVVPQHPPLSQRLWRAGRNVAVGPDGYPLSVHRRRVGLEVAKLLLLLGIQPPLTTSHFWRLVKAAVLVGQTSIASQTGWQAETFALKRLLLISLLCLAPGSQAMDYVQCEVIQRAAARLKAAMDTEALASQNAIVLPAMEKAKERCHAEFVNDEVLNCMARRMAPFEAEGVLARESVVEKYAPRVDRVLDDYEAMSCY